MSTITTTQMRMWPRERNYMDSQVLRPKEISVLTPGYDISSATLSGEEEDPTPSPAK